MRFARYACYGMPVPVPVSGRRNACGDVAKASLVGGQAPGGAFTTRASSWVLLIVSVSQTRGFGDCGRVVGWSVAASAFREGGWFVWGVMCVYHHHPQDPKASSKKASNKEEETSESAFCTAWFAVKAGCDSVKAGPVTSGMDGRSAAKSAKI